MKNIYEIPEYALCDRCGEVKLGDEFARSQFLIYAKNPPVCSVCTRKSRSNQDIINKSLQTKVDQEQFIKDQILTILGYDLNRDIHEQFLERHPNLFKK